VDGALLVRAATTADCAVLADIIAAAFAEYEGKLIPESAALLETPAKLAAELAAGSRAFVALSGATSVGCVMTSETAGDLYFGRLSVLPTMRGRGVARALVSAVEAEAERRNLAGVRLSVRITLPQNQAFFSALGYKEIGRAAHPGFAEPTFIMMRKASGSSAAGR
jgi:ribosomal protein S18 acetylase RimI-like enzyme